jgi:hypothetical protein
MTAGRWIALILVTCAAALLGVLSLLTAEARPETLTPADYSVGTVAGVRYDAVLGRPVNPSNPVDARILKGIAAKDRRLRGRRVLFGAFVSLTNPSRRALPNATRIELRDDAQHVYRPLRLPATNPYAYRPGRLAPGAHIPRPGTPAADNLAAGGRLLLFRVPAWRYRNGTFELLVHDPLKPGAATSIPL